MSKYILDDIVEEFFDEDSIEQDIHQHPLSWSLALLCVLPPIVFILAVTSGNNLTDSQIFVIFAALAYTLTILQPIIAPILCFLLAYKKHLAPALLVALGSSAIVLSNSNTLDRILSENTDIGIEIRIVIALIIQVPYIIVLRKKRHQLNPGRSRQVWATLMAVSTLMFAAGTLVPTVATHSEFGGYAWGSLGLVVMGVGWAWPRGRHLVEDIADDIVEAAT